eukprot:533920-Rhodomonas_salina.2
MHRAAPWPTLPDSRSSPHVPPPDPDWRHNSAHLCRERHGCRQEIGMEADLDVGVLLVGPPPGSSVHQVAKEDQDLTVLHPDGNGSSRTCLIQDFLEHTWPIWHSLPVARVVGLGLHCPMATLPYMESGVVGAGKEH